MRIPHSIHSHFFYRGFAAWRAENRVSIVLCPTNNTQTSTVYKLTGGPTGCLAEYCICIVLEHMQIPHSILGHFLDPRYVDSRYAELRLSGISRHASSLMDGVDLVGKSRIAISCCERSMPSETLNF
jgi:hypothetical protein